jgi:hypothetical protein
VVGIVLIVIGVLQIRGDLSMLHYYHRKRVKEEDKKPFGKLVGLGSIIIGSGIIIAGALSFIAKTFALRVLDVVSLIVIGLSLIVGLIIIFYAMIKYNKGIF